MPIQNYESHDALGLAEQVCTGETTAEALLDAALERLDRLASTNLSFYFDQGLAAPGSLCPTDVGGPDEAIGWERLFLVARSLVAVFYGS